MALACDYDGTLATDGRVPATVFAAIERLRASGRRSILITGRRLEELSAACDRLDLFDYVVAENGAVLYAPRRREETILGQRPSDAFIRRLASLGVEPIEVGRVIVATWLPHHVAVLQAIQEMGLELHIIFNRRAVMVLPAGINKAQGMEAALRKLGLSRHEVVGIGDSANDHSFLSRCECPVAVSNAEPSIRQLAHFVTKAAAGHGVIEVIDALLKNDLSQSYGRFPQHLVALGQRIDGTTVSAPPYGLNILIAGPSGSGKSTATAGIVERLIDQSYQVCIIDPEGDYGTLQEVITLGNEGHAVRVGEVMTLLEDPTLNLNVNLLGIPYADRPAFFCQLLPNLQAIRTRTGRPHWIVFDEAHHMMPAEWSHLGSILPQSMGEVVLVTVHPGHLARSILTMIDMVIAVGPSPKETLQEIAGAVDRPLRWSDHLAYQSGCAVMWHLRQETVPFSMRVGRGRSERLRHHRKYAVGDMRHDSFYFRGPDGRQNIKAQNLVVFCQIAAGIDEETWLFHLNRGDYSCWLRDAVKDNYLADQTQRIEQRPDLQPADSRALIRKLIEARYTLPE